MDTILAKRAKPSDHGDDTLKEDEVIPTGLWSDIEAGLKHAPELLHAWSNSDKMGNRTFAYWMLSALPDSSARKAAQTVEKIDGLWSKLLHPPLSYQGDLYQYRTYQPFAYPDLDAANLLQSPLFHIRVVAQYDLGNSSLFFWRFRQALQDMAN